MKRMLLLISCLISVVLFSTLTMAAEKTDAYNKFLNTVTQSYYDEYGNLGMIDTMGNVWKADYVTGKDNMNVLSMYTRKYDYETAKALYDKLGGDVYFDVPITLNTENDYYDIIICIYKDMNINLACARPKYLYPEGYKVLGEWNSTNADVLMFKVNDTSSFRCNTNLPGVADGGHVWGNGFYAEEETSLYDGYGDPYLDNSSNNTLGIREEIKYSHDVSSQEEVRAYLDRLNQPTKEVEFGLIPNGSGFFP